MGLARHVLLALAIGLPAAIAPGGPVAFTPGVAVAQQADKPLIDFAPMVPPVFPLPPKSQVTPGGVGSPQQSPYTTAPLQDPAPSVRDRQPAPGLKLTVPIR